MNKIIGYTLAAGTIGTTYMALCVAYPVAVIGKAGIDFTVEFIDKFGAAYNES